jgi:HEAT repeat protein
MMPEDEIYILSLIENLKVHSAEQPLPSTIKKLVDIGAPAVKYLIDALQSPSVPIRIGAVDVLGQLKDARAIVPLLDLNEDSSRRQGLHDPEDWDMGWIGSALMQIGRANLDELIKQIHRHGVIHILGEIGDPRAIEPLINEVILGDRRYPAISALNRMKNPQATESLLRLICDPQTDYWEQIFKEIRYNIDNELMANIITRAPSERRDILQTMFDEYQTRHRRKPMPV